LAKSVVKGCSFVKGLKAEVVVPWGWRKKSNDEGNVKSEEEAKKKRGNRFGRIFHTYMRPAEFQKYLPTISPK
jgi:hypothetical protein